MAQFKVYGPFRIDLEKRPGGRVILDQEFWQSHRKLTDLRTRAGVYVFAIKSSGGNNFTPYYVGQATKSFDREIFTPDKLVKFYSALSHFERGFPVLFLVVAPKKKGPTNKREIRQIEDNFIRLAYSVNPEIENAQGIKQPRWSISGVIRSKTTRRSLSAKRFTEMFELGVGGRR